MWRIVDNSEGKALNVSAEAWGRHTAERAMYQAHDFGVAMDIAHEPAYVGFEIPRDFSVRLARAELSAF
jgi:hypothetical protein